MLYNQLCEEVRAVFGISSTNVKLFANDKEVTSINLATNLLGKTLSTEPRPINKFESVEGSICPFVDVQYQDKSATLLLENPAGCSVKEYTTDIISTLFGKSLKIKNGSAKEELHNVTQEKLKTFYGKTIELFSE